MVSQKLGVEHHEFIFEPDLINIIPTLAYHFGEPLQLARRCRFITFVRWCAAM